MAENQLRAQPGAYALVAGNAPSNSGAHGSQSLCEIKDMLQDLTKIVSHNAKLQNTALSSLQGGFRLFIRDGKRIEPPEMSFNGIDDFDYMDIFHRTSEETRENHMRYWSQFTVASFANRIQDVEDWYDAGVLNHDANKCQVDPTTSGISLLAFRCLGKARPVNFDKPVAKGWSGIVRLLFRDRIIQTRNEIDHLLDENSSSDSVLWLSAFGKEAELIRRISDAFNSIECPSNGQVHPYDDPSRKRPRPHSPQSARMASMGIDGAQASLCRLVIQNSMSKSMEKASERLNVIQKYLFETFFFLFFFMRSSRFFEDIPADKREQFNIEVNPLPAPPEGKTAIDPGGFLHVEQSEEDHKSDGANEELKTRIRNRHKWLDIRMVFYRKVATAGLTAEKLSQLPDKENQLLLTTRRLNLYDIALDLVLHYFQDSKMTALFRASSMSPRAVMVVALALRCLIQKFFHRSTSIYEEVAASKVCALLEDEDPGEEIFSLMYGSGGSWSKNSGRKKPLYIALLEKNITVTYEEYMREQRGPIEDTSHADDFDTRSVDDASVYNAPSRAKSYALDKSIFQEAAK